MANISSGAAIEVLDELTKGRKWAPVQPKWKCSKDGMRLSCVVRADGLEGKGEGKTKKERAIASGKLLFKLGVTEDKLDKAVRLNVH